MTTQNVAPITHCDDGGNCVTVSNLDNVH